MSSLDVWFGQVWDAIVAKVVAITDFGASKVFWGKKFPIAVFPAAYVQPTMVEGTPKTWTETDWAPVFTIYIVVENPDSKAGVLTAWQLGWKIITALQTDRSLGGLLNTLTCGPLLDSPEGLGRGTEQHWVSVAVRCQRKM